MHAVIIWETGYCHKQSICIKINLAAEESQMCLSNTIMGGRPVCLCYYCETYGQKSPTEKYKPRLTEQIIEENSFTIWSLQTQLSPPALPYSVVHVASERNNKEHTHLHSQQIAFWYHKAFARLYCPCPRWFPGQETAIHFLFFKPLSSTYRKRKFSKNSMNSCSLLLLSLELGVQAAASCC